ncbi:hypothetical protein JKP88DRAFT_248288 [Tribonema minus]|uniref:Uncharacterized protein n=1 Tax=Tribonema minus TaxID=303371 RepID=A0A835YMQ9_9STRA|nr:hypothetical protein JKP88DRAFT_248288 [Tribonema minus]
MLMQASYTKLKYRSPWRNGSALDSECSGGTVTPGGVQMLMQASYTKLKYRSPWRNGSALDRECSGGTEQLPRSSSGQAQLSALQDWQPPDSNTAWSTRKQFAAMVDHPGDLLVARPTCAATAPSERCILVDFHRLLVSLVLDRCALDGVFYEWVDGQLCEVAGHKVIMLHGRCCQGKRPWMRVQLPGTGTGRRGGRSGINGCAVVLNLQPTRASISWRRHGCDGSQFVRSAEVNASLGIGTASSVYDVAVKQIIVEQMASSARRWCIGGVAARIASTAVTESSCSVHRCSHCVV